MATDAFVLISEPPQNTRKAIYANSMSTTFPNALFIWRLFNDVANNSEYTYKHRSDKRVDDGTRQKEEDAEGNGRGQILRSCPVDVRNREPPTANQKRQLSQFLSAAATVSL